MNILVVSHEFPPIGGGGANACLFLTRGYVQAGHKVTLVTVWYEGLKERENLDGVEIIRVRSKRAHKEHCSFQEMFSYIMKALPVAGRLERERKYDVCHVFFGIPSGVIGYWLKRRYRLPYIIRFGGGDIPGFQERFKLVYKAIAPFVRMIWRNADALVANSEGLRQFALEFYDKREIKVIYNGVDTEKFYPDAAKRNRERINLLFVSRLIERKGLQYVIPKLKEIQKAANKPIRLTVVGDGPYRKALEDLAVQHDVADMVSFEGQKDKEELLPYYQGGDIFVFPSKREGMPNAVLEAMACGLPIVMAPCEGSEELIQGNGIVVSADEMGEALSMVLGKGHLGLWGKESRKRAEDIFSWDSAIRSYLKLLEKDRKDI